VPTVLPRLGCVHLLRDWCHRVESMCTQPSLWKHRVHKRAVQWGTPCDSTHLCCMVHGSNTRLWHMQTGHRNSYLDTRDQVIWWHVTLQHSGFSTLCRVMMMMMILISCQTASCPATIASAIPRVHCILVALMMQPGCLTRCLTDMT
jgi:hypothetical protein